MVTIINIGLMFDYDIAGGSAYCWCPESRSKAIGVIMSCVPMQFAQESKL